MADSLSGWNSRTCAGRASTIEVAVPNMRVGDSVPLGKRTFRVIGTRDDDADQPPVLVVEEC
jgi:hypothetical protein